MFSGLKDFFNNTITDAPAENDQSVAVAVCALLLEIAYADDEFSDSERETIITSVSNQFELNQKDAVTLLEIAEHERNTKTGMFQFTNLIAEKFDRTGKLKIVEALWQVVYSDGYLEAHEDALMHNLANLLGLGHKDLIALKLRVNKQ
ncbi:TerB family tellurite resistance protein [bacterium]|jgi:uncharacterized tellurite resistance protein B-like protein|nr:TerB family tellurite resistance protein [bacterium]MBT4292133.1 TerB family tellurite resistance protein [bacterium]MBT7311648.1 TerB family tellurite resistance protein [bacterium]